MGGERLGLDAIDDSVSRPNRLERDRLGPHHLVTSAVNVEQNARIRWVARACVIRSRLRRQRQQTIALDGARCRGSFRGDDGESEHEGHQARHGSAQQARRVAHPWVPQARHRSPDLRSTVSKHKVCTPLAGMRHFVA